MTYLLNTENTSHDWLSTHKITWREDEYSGAVRICSVTITLASSLSGDSS
jgi:hypothetical protein